MLDTFKSGARLAIIGSELDFEGQGYPALIKAHFAVVDDDRESIRSVGWYRNSVEAVAEAKQKYPDLDVVSTHRNNYQNQFS